MFYSGEENRRDRKAPLPEERDLQPPWPEEVNARTTAPLRQPRSDVRTQTAATLGKKRSSCFPVPNQLLLSEQENVSEAKQIRVNLDHRQN